MTPLEKLIAKDEMRETIYLYARCMDRCDNDLVSQIFTPGCLMDYGTDFQGDAVGFCDYAKATHTKLYEYTSHQFTNISIQFKSDTQAVSETYGIVTLFGRPGAMGAKPNGRKILTVHNRYIDRWQKCEDGKWRICERHMLNEQNNLKDAGYYAGSHGSCRGKDDIVYRFFE